MAKKTKNQRIEDIIQTMKSVREALGKTEDYNSKVSSYLDMRDGGTGGFFRKTESTIRELHFKNWKNSDFQSILESLGETAVLSEEEKAEAFKEENRTFLDKLAGIFSSKEK